MKAQMAYCYVTAKSIDKMERMERKNEKEGGVILRGGGWGGGGEEGEKEGLMK